MRLTDPQLELLLDLFGGSRLVGHDDRHGSYSWTVEPSGRTAPFVLVDALVTKGMLIQGQPGARLGGRRSTPYHLSDRGKSCAAKHREQTS